MDKKLSCECRPPAAAPELAVPEAGRGRGERAVGTPLFLTPAALLTAPCPGEPGGGGCWAGTPAQRGPDHPERALISLGFKKIH